MRENLRIAAVHNNKDIHNKTPLKSRWDFRQRYWHIVSIFKIFPITPNIKGKTNNKKKLAVQILWRLKRKQQSKMKWI